MTQEEKIASLESQVRELKLFKSYENKVKNRTFLYSIHDHYFKLCDAFEGDVFTQGKAEQVLGMSKDGCSVLIRHLLQRDLLKTVKLHSVSTLDNDSLLYALIN